ncbi:uncharacterized protein F5891DRAFT_1060441 [Suillus fuscotomentosus]|uniref:Uncharacterized protein n=1 Tax=Suillus fuscotomentosus TaxID=1912939 RepID=A0AAD4DYE6_9AGAM|nr:uncharacterized protein F5891DRAFT_1060441 [Suillus fuscotomentosus]KAG1894918.1 hypothetical protein F5891DRAFT_1060441 [Suillus fuscotomentosus]
MRLPFLISLVRACPSSYLHYLVKRRCERCATRLIGRKIKTRLLSSLGFRADGRVEQLARIAFTVNALGCVNRVDIQE